jgi:nitrate/TMAO reductase-like tetraheme cytochrome c subunit/mono/diheme cytochrome c family protein
LPYLTLGGLTVAVLIGAAYAWDYTNSPEFCGTFCHTMPPEYTAYLVSPHARVDCVDCHIGRGFIATRITRKAGDIRHIVATAFRSYEFPIRADNLRPARETCEKCHFPEKFSDDSLREIKTFADDLNNTPTSIYLTLKTGGGTKRQGLGRGIHWHIENEVYYLPLDPEEQEIPYIHVVEDDGSITEYVEIGSEIDVSMIEEGDLKLVDCITCHNRITHLVPTPEDSVDQLLARGVISNIIPEIRRKAIEVLRYSYDSNQQGIQGIAGLESYYQVHYADFYSGNQELVSEAVLALQDYYRQSVFPEQKSDWDTHFNNIGHEDSPGCFRCHGGKHLNQNDEAIRLECNLCHSIPIVSGPSDFIVNVEISRGPEPESHLNPNWITIHRDVFDPTCVNCHTVDNPGGTDNSSFCSNSACHGSAWEYAGFDAPGLREILFEQVPPPAELGPEIGALTYVETIGPLFAERCGNCHGEDGLQGLNLTAYTTTLEGGLGGPAIVPGDPDGSRVIQKMTTTQPHFSRFSPEELNLVIEWIEAGAPEQ